MRNNCLIICVCDNLWSICFRCNMVRFKAMGLVGTVKWMFMWEWHKSYCPWGHDRKTQWRDCPDSTCVPTPPNKLPEEDYKGLNGNFNCNYQMTLHIAFGKYLETVSFFFSQFVMLQPYEKKFISVNTPKKVTNLWKLCKCIKKKPEISQWFKYSDPYLSTRLNHFR